MDDRICPWHPYGQHIQLRSKTQTGTWETKNISPIGCRSIFPQSNNEALDSIRNLYHECPDSVEWSKLT
jgi:hypothetical protein